MRFPRLTLAVAGTVFVAIGLAFLLNPIGIARIVSLQLTGSGPVAVRAVDGGLQLGLGIFFWVATVRERWTRAGLGAVILTCGGLAFGRAVGMMIEGFDRVHTGFMGLELFGVAVGSAAFGRARAVYEASTIERRRLE